MISFILSIYTTEMLLAPPPHTHQITHIKFVRILSGQQRLNRNVVNVIMRTATLIRVYLVPSGAKLIILLVVLTFDIKALFSF